MITFVPQKSPNVVSLYIHLFSQTGFIIYTHIQKHRISTKTWTC